MINGEPVQFKLNKNMDVLNKLINPCLTKILEEFGINNLKLSPVKLTNGEKKMKILTMLKSTIISNNRIISQELPLKLGNV